MSVRDLLARAPRLPLVTQRAADRAERNAFDLGVDAGAAGLVMPSAAMAAELEDDHTGDHP